MANNICSKVKLAEVFKSIEDNAERRGSLLWTGIKKIDQLLDFEFGNCILIAGNKADTALSMGLTIALNNALPSAGNSKPVAIFSGQRASGALLEMLISQRSEVPLRRLRSGSLADDSWPELTRAIADLENSPILITEGIFPQFAEFEKELNKIGRDHDIGLMIVDLGDMGRAFSANDQKCLVRGFGELARKINIPVVLTVAIQDRDEYFFSNNKVNSLWGLARSVDIENADLLMLLHESLGGENANGPIAALTHKTEVDVSIIDKNKGYRGGTFILYNSGCFLFGNDTSRFKSDYDCTLDSDSKEECPFRVARGGNIGNFFHKEYQEDET